MDELITKMKEVNDFIQSCNQNCENNIGLIFTSLEEKAYDDIDDYYKDRDNYVQDKTNKEVKELVESFVNKKVKITIK